MRTKKIFLQILLALIFTFLWTPGFSQELNSSDYLLQNTKLSIDPSGKRILIAYGLKTRNPNVIIAQKDEEKFSLTRIAPINPNIRYIGFSSEAKHLLELSRTENTTTLTRFNFETGQKQLIYEDLKEIWIPREIGPDDYVYFQATRQTPTQGIWVRQQNGTQEILFPTPDRLSARANWTGDSIYVMNWTTPRSFFALIGKVPTEAANLVKEPGVWEITCANSEPLQCAKEKLQLTKFGYLTTVEITKGPQACEIKGEWFDLRELQISENGSFVIFHAKTPGKNGLRSIYLASYAEKKCALDIVFSERDGKWELQ